MRYYYQDAEELTTDTGGENNEGLGGICKDSKLPSNISSTPIIDGRFVGSI